ncbi:Low affinity potassium transport system protein kup [Gemmatirosa kalamazoonensis]|uniref:Probable potassium transport system protein Kup n=1 Tax=Gemmatirosa kalamazoonensis TaxID=861299 RepID=W0RI03_9BACT|nr:potassium transporter Kup [Gemmatirosa kalamazoonensis]AHG89965.1 Low affinity potassium transport system protein kup [Gemmatirosa kalamazoonensis]
MTQAFPTETHPTTGAPHHHRPDANPTGRRLATLMLTALGVVYGDIGTSPLYSIKECFRREFGLAVTPVNVYGVLSLIVWALVLVVSVKYVAFILRADNKGEGGVFALLALILARQQRDTERRTRAILITMGLFGGAFLYGDGMITPAISVLGAVEGLQIVTPALAKFIVPITFAIIFTLFYFQYKGTAKVGGAFGWIMLAWFVSIGVLGIMEITQHPGIFRAMNPWYAVTFFPAHPKESFVVLGAVVLVITGGEALYADMGHFGRKPIRWAWFGFVLPCLLLNYFGQGALVLRDRTAVSNPFYMLAPPAFQIPLLVIATLAAIVASQALISGAFSLTQQAVQLGYTPRLNIVHTSSEQAGQIYIPEVNKALAVGTLLLVVAFRSSAALAATYGVAVTATMAITTMLFVVIARQRFGWSKLKARTFLYGFLFIDLLFLASNLLKVPHGGWVPLTIAGIVFLLMTTWKKGRDILLEHMETSSLPMDAFISDVARRKPHRVSGTAVFMTSARGGAPVVLLHHLKHMKVLHQQVILLSIRTADVPDVDEQETLEVEELGQGFWRVLATYGFMEQPNVPDIMKFLNARGVRTRPGDTSFFLGRERLIATGKSRMARWRKKIFALMSRNALSATEFFSIPPNRVVELGAQIEF